VVSGVRSLLCPHWRALVCWLMLPVLMVAMMLGLI
jgi:hypothetical protein